MAYKYPYDYEEKEKPRAKLPTNRSMWKFMILDILTLGLYSIFFFVSFSLDLEKVTPQGSSKPISFVMAWGISICTFRIAIDIWHYQTAVAVSEALKHRNIDFEFGTDDFWKWFIFGSFILVGPFIYFNKLCKAMNLLCEHYNENPVVF